MFQNHRNSRGFTLVEMAIVLIVIGIILGMVFKGRQLIDGAKVKSLQSNYTKIEAAVNTFYDRYGYYPGDGCQNNSNPSTPADCGDPKDGRISNSNEFSAFWKLLINTGILTTAERKTVSGTEWNITYATYGGKTGNWLYANIDGRYICTLDQKIDDGNWNSGLIQVTNSNAYDDTTDCWALQSTPLSARLYLLP